MLTPERLREIKERCERATPGPWIVSPNRHKAKDGSQWGIIEARIRTVTGGIVAHTICTWDGDNGRANAEFAAHAREDVPVLVAEVEQLHRFAKEIRRTARHWRRRAKVMMAKGKASDRSDDAHWFAGQAEAFEQAAWDLEIILDSLGGNENAE